MFFSPEEGLIEGLRTLCPPPGETAMPQGNGSHLAVAPLLVRGALQLENAGERLMVRTTHGWRTYSCQRTGCRPSRWRGFATTCSGQVSRQHRLHAELE